MLLPILSLAYVALSGTGEDWPHLVRNVLPGASATTLYLLALVAAATRWSGVASAWMVVAYEFPLRRTLSWALVLPLAVPSYLAAYAFGEFFDYSGPVQSLVRAVFGFADHPRLLVSRHPLDARLRASCCRRCSIPMSISPRASCS